MAEIHEEVEYTAFETKNFTELYSFLKIPTVAINLNLSQTLSKLQTQSKKLHLIPVNSSRQDPLND